MNPGDETLQNENIKPKILIVDDVPENIELIEAYLSVETYALLLPAVERRLSRN